MDPGTAIGVAQLGLQVCQGLVEYYKAWRSYEKDIAVVTASIQDLLGLFEDVSETLSNINATGQGRKILQRADEAAAKCLQDLEVLKTELSTVTRYQDRNDIRFKLEHHLRRTLYPFRKGTLKDLRDIVTEARSHLTEVLNVLQVRKIADVEQSVAENKDMLLDIKQYVVRKDVRDWLGAPDPSSSHQDAAKKRHGSTGQWLLDSKIYGCWMSDQNSFLWIHGFVGCGKTIMASTIINDLKMLCNTEEDSACAYYYFTFSNTAVARPSSMIKSLLIQLSEQIVQWPVPLYEAFNPTQRLTDRDEAELLRISVSLFKKVFLVVDALDECVDRETLLESLDMIRSWSLDQLHFLVISRDEVDLRDGIKISKPWEELSLQTSGQDEDIKEYISMSLATDNRLKKWFNLRSFIEEKLIKGAKGMFRWVECQLQALRRCRSPNEVKRALEKLPPTLEGTYQRIIESIPRDDFPLACRLLQWICYSQEPMSFEALRDVLAVDIPEDDKSAACFDFDNRFSRPEDLLTLCPSFLTISAHESVEYLNIDKTDYDYPVRYEVLQLAHFSVQEFLKGKNSTVRIDTASAYETMAISCIAYLLAPQDIDTIDVPWIDFNQRFPFMQAAAKQLRPLLLKANTTRDWFRPAIDLIKSNTHHRLYWRTQASTCVSLNSFYITGETMPSPLHTAAYWGNLDFANLLIDQGEGNLCQWWDGVERGSSYIDYKISKGTPLHIAAGSGFTEMVLDFLRREPSCIPENRLDDTPAMRAVLSDAIECLRVLIPRVKEPLEGQRDTEDVSQTELDNLLLNASEVHHSEMITLLLRHGASRQKTDESGRIPAMITAFSSRGNLGANAAECFKLLWFQGAESVQDHHGDSALHMATISHEISILKWLLKRGVSTESKNHEGRTPLLTACQNRSSNRIEMLFHYGANGHAYDAKGWTTLHYFFESTWPTTSFEPRKIVELLGEQGGDPTRRDDTDWLPIQRYIVRRHYLLEKDRAEKRMKIRSLLDKLQADEDSVELEELVNVFEATSEESGMLACVQYIAERTPDVNSEIRKAVEWVWKNVSHLYVGYEASSSE